MPASNSRYNKDKWLNIRHVRCHCAVHKIIQLTCRGPYGFIKICLVCVSRASVFFYAAKVWECRVIVRLIRKDSDLLDFGKGHMKACQHHMGHLDFHTSRHPCVIDSDRHWVTASTPSLKYSGGRWFLNHCCGWNRSASSPRGNNTLVTRVGAKSAQRGLCLLKTCVYFVCFSGDGRLFKRWVTAALWW